MDMPIRQWRAKSDWIWHPGPVNDRRAVSDTSGLRAENRRRTRARILDATVELVRESGTVDFSMPEVAARSGVALRTLYRYFQKRQDLVDALATVADQVEAGPLPSLDDLEEWLARAWRNLIAEEALIRAQHVGPAGVEVRRARVPLHRSVTLGLLDAECPGLDPRTRDDLADLALVLTSSTVLFEFVDVLDVDPSRGASLVARTVRTIIEQARAG